MFMQYFRQSEHSIAEEIYNAAYEDVQSILGPTWFDRNRYPKELALKNILINGHACLFAQDSDFGDCFDEIIMPFGKDYYSAGSHYRRALHFKYNNYVPTAKALVNAGYFIQRKGYFDKETGRGFHNRLFPASRLFGDGILLPEFTYDDALDSIELRDENKVPIWFTETQQIVRMSRGVDRYNKFMVPQVLGYIPAEDKSHITVFEDPEGRIKSSEPLHCNRVLNINTNAINNNILTTNVAYVSPVTPEYLFPTKLEHIYSSRSYYTTDTSEYSGPTGPYKLSGAGPRSSNLICPHPHNSVEKSVTPQYQQILRVGKIKSRRVFNNGRFDLGGRFYLQIQNLKRGERRTLLINGQPTVEPDFRALHPTMLYHQLDLHPPADCYRLFDGDGRDELLRPVVKLLLLMMINCVASSDKTGRIISGRTIAMRAFYSKWTKKVKAKPNKYPQFKEISKEVGLTLEEIIDRIMEVHAPIADSFFTGAGLRLQYLDSEIMRLILNQCIRAKIPVIPVHDSVVCPKNNEKEVIEIMRTAYFKRMKHSIEIG